MRNLHKRYMLFENSYIEHTRLFKCAEFPRNCATHLTANTLTYLVVEIKSHLQPAATQLAVWGLTT